MTIMLIGSLMAALLSVINIVTRKFPASLKVYSITGSLESTGPVPSPNSHVYFKIPASASLPDASNSIGTNKRPMYPSSGFEIIPTGPEGGLNGGVVVGCWPGGVVGCAVATGDWVEVGLTGGDGGIEVKFNTPLTPISCNIVELILYSDTT